MQVSEVPPWAPAALAPSAVRVGPEQGDYEEHKRLGLSHSPVLGANACIAALEHFLEVSLVQLDLFVFSSYSYFFVF